MSIRRDDEEAAYEKAWDTVPPMPQSRGLVRLLRENPGPTRTFNPAAISAALAGDVANALAASTPGGIEAQEAAGQRDLVEGEMIPRRMVNVTREQLEDAGFVFGDPVDDLFIKVKLPDGWSMKATSHSMHNDLIDDAGMKRANVFYKAAFYDRRADISFNSRLRISIEYSGGMRRVQVVDMANNGVAIHASEIHREDDYKTGDLEREKEEQWLNYNFPDHENPFAYWGSKISY